MGYLLQTKSSYCAIVSVLDRTILQRFSNFVVSAEQKFVGFSSDRAPLAGAQEDRKNKAQ